MSDVGQRVVRDLRNSLHEHMVRQSAAFFARRTTGQLLSRLTNDVAQVQHVVAETVGDLLQEGLSVVFFAGLLFYYDAKLALVCLTGAPIIIYPLAKLGRRLRRTTRRSQEALEHLSHVAGESFTGHRIVKAFGAEGREARKFGDASQQLYRTNTARDSCGGAAASDHGTARGVRDSRRARLRQPADRGGPPDHRRVLRRSWRRSS